MPFDASLITKISPLIEGQVPDFVQSDHPIFVQFLKQYYQFLESAELIVSGTINHLVLEKTDTQYILPERELEGTKLVTETGTGSTGKFVVNETITGGTSNATATVLVDDLENLRLFISSQQKFEIGETITGGTSAATATVTSYRANPVASIQKLLDYANPDNTVATMLDEMFNQFMTAIPKTLASGTSKRDLIKNIKDLYAAKGTQEGHRLFLRMMFAEEAEISYPNKYMFRISDGKWLRKTLIRCESQPGANGADIIGEYLTGVTSGTTCFVINAITFQQGATSITEFEILKDSVVGTFIQGETHKASSLTEKVEMKFTIQKIVADTTVNSGGILYATGDVIDLDSTVGNDRAVVQVDQTATGSIDDVIVDVVGSEYRVNDPLVFTTTGSGILSAVGFVSVVGGSPLLEDSDNSDGYDDYLNLELGSKSSFIDFSLTLEDGDYLLLNGTDSSSTNAGYYFQSEPGTAILITDTYGTENDRIVFEEGTSSTLGEVTRIYVSEGGSGYSELPTVTITSKFGTSVKLIPTTKEIGKILSIKITDSGFNYQTAPEATIAANYVLKNVSGNENFAKDIALTSHEGTITAWDSDKQILSVDIEDVVRVQMEQDNSAVSQQIEQETNTELVFSRVLGNNILETNDVDYWKYFSDQNITSLLTSFVTEDSAYNLVTDADASGVEQITLENTDSDLATAGIQLEDRGADSMDDAEQDSVTKHFLMQDYAETPPTLILEASAVGDSILLEGNVGATATVNGATTASTALVVDGNSGTITVGMGIAGTGVSTTAPAVTVITVTDQNNLVLSEVQTLADDVDLEFIDLGTSTDELLLDRTAAGGADAGDKLLQQSTDEGGKILYESHLAISNLQQRKDKLQLDGAGIQLFNAGGWMEEDSSITAISSQIVTTPDDTVDLLVFEQQGSGIVNEQIRLEVGIPDGGLILEEQNSVYILMEDDATSVSEFIRFEAFNDSWILRDGLNVVNNYYGGGLNLRYFVALEGNQPVITSVPHDIERSRDEGEGILLEDYWTDGSLTTNDSSRTVNSEYVILLEGIDGNSGGTDVNGFYNIYEEETVDHANDSSGRLISEDSEPLINEAFSSEQNMGSGKIMMNNHIIAGDEILLVMNGTDDSGTNSGDSIILDGVSATERAGNTLVQESGLLSGVDDNRIGDDLLMEPESMVAGDIILNGTDGDSTNAGDNIIGQGKIDWLGATITAANGATGKIVAADIADISITNDFITTDAGYYRNTDSHISEDIIRIQDSYYYQDFSYEVKLGQSVSNYMNELKKAIHPAGFMPFGKVIIASSIVATMPFAGAGRVDAGETTFSPILASALKAVFDLRIKKRIGIPHTYEQGSYFQELRLENGTIPDSKIAIDGTNYGIALQQEDGVIVLQSLANDGDNILITASDDGSQDDAGDNIILDGTDADGTDDGDVTGTYGYLILNGTSTTTSGSTTTVNDDGSYLLLSGTALGVYELIDASDNSLVLNGTDDFPTGKRDRLMYEDGDHAGSNIVTDNLVKSTTLVETGGPIQAESAVSNIRGPYICTEKGERIVSENFAETLTDGPILDLQNAIGLENSNGDNIIFEDTSGVLMTEASVGTTGDGHDVNFVRLLKTKIHVPPPTPLNQVGLSHMVLDTFGDSLGTDSIQLEDGARKRGPTINSDRLLLDSIDMGKKGDPTDYAHSGEPIELEVAAVTNMGVGTSFTDFYKFSRYEILLDGTDSDGSNSGDNIALEAASHGKIISEEVVIGLPMTDFLRPDLMVLETIQTKHSEYGRVLLDGSASDSSTGAIDDGSNVLLDGIDAMQTDAGEQVLFETDNEENKSHDDRNDVSILMETHGEGGGFILREYGGGDVTEGDNIVLNGTDSDSTDAADNIVQEDTESSRVTQASGAFALENDNVSHILLDDNSGCIANEDGTGDIILSEINEGAGHDVILEVGTDTGVGFRLILEAQRIEIESGINDGEVPTASFGDNTVFPTLTSPTEISIRPLGHVVLQDEGTKTNQTQEGDTGDDLLLEGTDTRGAIALNGTNASSANENSVLILNGTNSTSHDAGGEILHEDAEHVDKGDNLLMDETILDHHHQGHLVLNATDGSATDAGDRIFWENGTYSSLLGTYPAFIAKGAQAETYDNTTATTFDSTEQTFDVVEGD